MKILIAEDELIVAEHLKMLLTSFGVSEIQIVSNFEDAIKLISNWSPNCCFLDIRLQKSGEGILIAKWINENNPIPFLFLSAHSDIEQLKEALSTEPITYLTKPFKESDIFAAYQMILAKLEKKENYIILKDSTVERKIHLRSIYFIQSDKNYIDFVGDFGKISIRQPLKWAESILPQQQFYRVHKSFLVNLDNIESLQSSFVKISEFKIPISRNTSLEELKKAMRK
jgi:DNA-binding LytR/AlgR family response regulator